MSFAAQKLPLPSLELIVPAYELPEVLPDDIVALKALIFAQQAAYAATIGTVTRAAHASIQRIIEQVVLARHRQFGASSEQMPSQARLFDEAEALAHDTEDKQDIAPVPQERVPEQDSDKQSKKSARGKRHPCLLIYNAWTWCTMCRNRDPVAMMDRLGHCAGTTRCLAFQGGVLGEEGSQR